MMETPSQHDDSGRSHRSHFGTFTLVFLMLCGLTGLSFWIANSSLMENQWTAWMAMLAVSFAKALLVVLFFMHLWWEKQWKYVLTIPALIMGGLLVILLIPDIGMRTNHYTQERSRIAPLAGSFDPVDESPTQ